VLWGRRGHHHRCGTFEALLPVLCEACERCRHEIGTRAPQGGLIAADGGHLRHHALDPFVDGGHLQHVPSAEARPPDADALVIHLWPRDQVANGIAIAALLQYGVGFLARQALACAKVAMVIHQHRKAAACKDIGIAIQVLLFDCGKAMRHHDGRAGLVRARISGRIEPAAQDHAFGKKFNVFTHHVESLFVLLHGVCWATR